jgi:alpha-beta hydrolase superfamily lysophospholipase
MASKVSRASSFAQAAGRLSGQPDERAATHESVLAADGTRLHVLRWLPQTGSVRASVLYLHGIATHGAWFSETAELLIDKGIAVYAPDRRGSGRSDGPRGHVDDLGQALSDVDRVLDRVVTEQPGRPVFLAGSSWASKLAVAYAVEHPERLTGLLLLAAGIVPKVTLPLGQRLVVLAAQKVRPQLRLPIPLTPEMYTRSRPHQEFIRTDPLRINDATARFYWETNRLDRRRNRLAQQLRVPTLLMMGGSDVMMDVAGTRRWFQRIGTPDRKLVLYPEAAHTLDFEDRPEEYRADLLRWIEDHLPAECG